jgi:hypothetical protein
MSAKWRAFRTVLGGLVGVTLLVNCEGGSQTIRSNPESRLRLLPQELTPLAGCQQSSGNTSDMSAYVATLIDVTPDDDDKVEPKAVISGRPTTCTSSITFSVSADRGKLELGHSYVALVDGYTAQSLMSSKTGKRPVTTNGSAASPAWQWLCSFGGLPKATLSDLLSIAQEIARASPTSPLADAGVNEQPDGSVDSTTDAPDAQSGPELDANDGTSLESDANLSNEVGSDAAMPDDSAARDAAVFDSALADSAMDDDAADSALLDAALVADAAVSRASSSDAAATVNETQSSTEAPDASGAATESLSSTSSGSGTVNPGADAALPDTMVIRSALETLLEIAKQDEIPTPALLVQSSLGTLRGCVALP